MSFPPPPRLLVVGLSHRTAPIEVRERFLVGEERLEGVLRDLVAHPAIRECVVLSTCNRTEYYLASREPDAAAAATTARMAGEAGLAPARAAGYLFRHEEFEAVTHLYRVTSGLDSLVIGEPQIQGQVGDAYDAGRDRVPDAVGPVLHRLFQSAVAAGGRVRTETRIAHGNTSIPSAAVSLARKVFGSLRGRAVLVVGTGEMGALTVRCLRSEGVGRVLVASRDPGRARRLGRRVGGEALADGDAWRRLGEVDLVVTAATAERPIVGPEWFEGLGGRTDLVVLDIAVPRNVDAAVGDLPGVFLYNIDDLQRVVDAAEEARVGESAKAEAIVDRHAARFWDWYRVRTAVPAIRRLREGATEIAERELERRLAERPPAGGGTSPEELRLATRSALNKILHVPTEALRRVARRPNAASHLESILRLLERVEDPPRRRANEGGDRG